ncbi:hypothetical protein GA0115255_105792 [Streptomyces sp. Ncost-T6T-2b]|nr:hypothetical protein GA0115255_105792 [Streptomyces sp. Ncost-T6T-2b]
MNRTGAANVSFAYAPRTSAAVDKTKPRTPARHWARTSPTASRRTTPRVTWPPPPPTTRCTPTPSRHPRLNDVTVSYQGSNTALLQWTQPLDAFAIRWSDYRLHRTPGTDRPSGEATDSPEHCLSLRYRQEAGRLSFRCTATVTPGATNNFTVEPYHDATMRALPSAPISVTVPAAPAPATGFRGLLDGNIVDLSWNPADPGAVDHYEIHDGFWYPATTPDTKDRFYSLNMIKVPGDAGSFRWPYLASSNQGYVIVAVAADGTKKTLEQSPRIPPPTPATD